MSRDLYGIRIASDVYTDSPEKIQSCLNCTRKECVDCFDHHYQAVIKKETKCRELDVNSMNCDEKLLVEYYLEGMTDKELVPVIGLPQIRISAMRKSLGLKTLTGRTRAIRKRTANGWYRT